MIDTHKEVDAKIDSMIELGYKIDHLLMSSNLFNTLIKEVTAKAWVFVDDTFGNTQHYYRGYKVKIENSKPQDFTIVVRTLNYYGYSIQNF